MKHLYAPWRGRYITNDLKSKNGCVFCSQFAEQQDEKNFILKRFEHTVIMLNLHPYNAGHLMVLPYKHCGELTQIDKYIRAELMETTALCMNILQKTLACDGINMGINQGKSSGGSIPEHLHIHIIPRWLGDTNFLVALADTKVISFDLPDMYTKLLGAFK
jgi:ATP adenylyltransferase